MLMVRPVKSLLHLLGRNWKFGLPVFIVGTAVCLTVGTFWPKQYKGTALITLNLSLMTLNQPPSPSLAPPELNQRSIMAAQLREASGRLNWNDLVSRYHPYPELLSTSGSARTAAYLASRVSIEPLADSEAGGNVARISYMGSDRNAVFGIVNEVADDLVKPAVSIGNAPAKAAPAPLYVPVVLPIVEAQPEPAPRHLGKRGRLREIQRTRRRRRGVAAPLDAAPVDAPQAGAANVPTPVGPGLDSPTLDAAVLSAALQASETEGVKLEDALSQNAVALDSLKSQASEQQSRIQSVSAPSNATATLPGPAKATPQEERLRQDLASAQRELAMLRDRYTDRYPDVVAATERVHDLLLDMSRVAAASPAPVRPPTRQPEPDSRQAVAQTLLVLQQQVDDAEAMQTKLQDAVARNQERTANLRTQLAATGQASDSTVASGTRSFADQPLTAASDTAQMNQGASLSSGSAAPASLAPMGVGKISPFFLVAQPEIATAPLIFAAQFLWPLSFVFGFFAAAFAAWLSERRDPAIRNEMMLRRELPASAVYLGGIPRIRHEVIAD